MATEIIDEAPDGYPHCSGCGYVFETDEELLAGDCECEESDFASE